MKEKMTMEEIENSSTQYWWVGWEPRDPDEPWQYQIVAIPCVDGCSANIFSTPAFGASNIAAWLYENGHMQKNGYIRTYTQEQIYDEQFLHEDNFNEIAGYYTRLYKASSLTSEALAALGDTAPLVLVTSNTLVVAVFASTAAEEKFKKGYPEVKLFQSYPDWDAVYISNPGNLVNWEDWG